MYIWRSTAVISLSSQNVRFINFNIAAGEEEVDFLQTDNGIFDHNLFGLIWGPAVAALSYIFDKVSDEHLLVTILWIYSCLLVLVDYIDSDQILLCTVLF